MIHCNEIENSATILLVIMQRPLQYVQEQGTPTAEGFSRTSRPESSSAPNSETTVRTQNNRSKGGFLMCAYIAGVLGLENSILLSFDSWLEALRTSKSNYLPPQIAMIPVWFHSLRRLSFSCMSLYNTGFLHPPERNRNAFQRLEVAAW